MRLLFIAVTAVFFFQSCGTNNNEAVQGDSKLNQQANSVKTQEKNNSHKQWEHWRDSLVNSSEKLLSVSNFIKKHKETYDTIPFTFETKGRRYFIVASQIYQDGEGKKWFKKMGIVNDSNKLLLPIEFEKIYNPGNILPNTLEVEHNGKIGLIALSGKIILANEYDLIYPGFGQYLACFKQGLKYGVLAADSTVKYVPEVNLKGFVDSLYGSHSGGNWNYDVKKEIPFQETFSMLEDIEFGSGTFFPSKFLVTLGLVDTVIEYVTVDDFTYLGETDHKITIASQERIPQKSFLLIIADFFRASSDARGEMEQSKIMTSISDEGAISNYSFSNVQDWNLCQDSLVFKRINDSLFEFKSSSWGETGYEYLAGTFQSYVKYSYVQLASSGEISELKSNKTFPFTSIINLDSSYFLGCWRKHITPNDSGFTLIKYDHLTLEDLDYMRNEIFADHGYKFQSEKWQTTFQKKNWYKGKYDNVDAALNEIEKANIKFILDYKKRMIESNNGKIKVDSLRWGAAG